MSMMKRMFGPSRKEMWTKLADEMHGRYVKGGFAKGDRVQVEHNDWTLTLDTYVVSTGKTVVVFTRMRAPFVNPSGFRFLVYRRSIFSGIGKFFGMQDIEIGDPPFDDGFIVQSTDEYRIHQLLGLSRIRELISAQKDINFGVKDDEGWFGTKFPEGVDELHFTVVGIIKDVDRLKQLYELFAETLDELCRMGAATDTPPGVQVK
jgi:hypothetical protein